MIEVRATHILSPLGNGARENYLAVKTGRSALARNEQRIGVPEPVTASMFSDEDWEEISVAGYTKFESLVIRSVAAAAKQTEIDLTSDKTVFILATTKGSIAELESDKSGTYTYPGQSAQKIAEYFGMTTTPVVVCNACISGASAQFLSMRLLESGRYNRAVVCGADCVSRFTAAGFLSFKALSPYECRPFDIERLGLNLGEAAATIIFARQEDFARPEGAFKSIASPTDAPATKDTWKLCRAAQTNDAYHISAPHPAGDGLLRAMNRVLEGFPLETLSCISVHGTATMFNDQAESKAIQNAGLSEVPVYALKGYYGHTLGAAGVLESILTMESLDDGIIPASRGFNEIGVSGKVNISGGAVPCPMARSFLKIMSGFGGCNAALLYIKAPCANAENERGRTAAVETLRSVHLDTQASCANAENERGRTAAVETLRSVHLDHQQNLTLLYKTRINNYPKFYKMDGLSRLLFTAAHLLLEGIDTEKLSSTPVILFNTSSSIVSDKKHIETYAGPEGFYPSPSVFLYTLPNIAVGEVAIYHRLTAETDLYILPKEDTHVMNEIVEACCPKGVPVITGWADYRGENDFKADLKLVIYK